MTREEFIDMYTNGHNSLVIGIRTMKILNNLLYLLPRLGIESPSSSIIHGLKGGLSENNEVGLLLKPAYGGGYNWSYTSNVNTLNIHSPRDYSVKWFDAVRTDVLEGDKL